MPLNWPARPDAKRAEQSSTATSRPSGRAYTTEILAPAQAAADPEGWDHSARQGASLTQAEAIAAARRPS
jgi:hypothetical protein